MWDLPGSGLEPVSPALAGGFFTTEPPGKPLKWSYFSLSLFCLMTEDEMVGWHHQLNEHGFRWTPGVGDGQGGLACYGSWGCKESDMTERLN